MDKILYSMCWEDPRLVLGALQVTNRDSVLTIASGGEVVFAMLLRNPKRLVAIDKNDAQLHVVRLKIAGIKALSFEEFAQFLGYAPCARRMELFARCCKHLPKGTIEFWQQHAALVEQGIIHAGKFEKYLARFRGIILPVVLSKKDIDEYLGLRSLAAQQQFYDQTWNKLRWRLLFRIFFSKTLLQIGRAKSAFAHNRKTDIAQHFLGRAAHGITKTPIAENYFMHYILKGTMQVPLSDHPYLDKKNFLRLKTRVDSIEIVHGDLREYLRNAQEGEFTTYMFSDAFELMTQQEYKQAIKQVARITANGRMCYWNNLVVRTEHPGIQGIAAEKALAEQLFKKDRAFFYSRFVVERIKRRPSARRDRS